MTAQSIYVLLALTLLVFIIALMIGRVVYLTGFNRGYHRGRDDAEGDPDAVIQFHKSGLGAEAMKARWPE